MTQVPTEEEICALRRGNVVLADVSKERIADALAGVQSPIGDPALWGVRVAYGFALYVSADSALLTALLPPGGWGWVFRSVNDVGAFFLEIPRGLGPPPAPAPAASDALVADISAAIARWGESPSYAPDGLHVPWGWSWLPGQPDMVGVMARAAAVGTPSALIGAAAGRLGAAVTKIEAACWLFPLEDSCRNHP